MTDDEMEAQNLRILTTIITTDYDTNLVYVHDSTGKLVKTYELAGK